MQNRLKTFFEHYFFMVLALVAGVAHFGAAPLTDRQLIRYDDHVFIEPMLKLDIKAYFQEWLTQRNNYAFPLRDLTFFADDFLSKHLGVQTFWITNFLLFLVVLYFIFKILKVIFPQQQSLIAVTVLLTATHPVLIEVVQWISIRKTILAFLFALLATDHLLRHSKQGEMSARNWRICFLYWSMSLLSWPTAVLWPQLACFMLYVQNPKLTQRSRYLKLAGLFLILSVSYIKLITIGERDYNSGLSSVVTVSNLPNVIEVVIKSVGRGFWNLVFPFEVHPFYAEDSSKGILGFLGLMAVLLLLVFRKERHFLEKKAEIKILAGLIIALFVPQFLVIINFDKFVWADRYCLVVIPWLVFLVLFAFKDAWSQWRPLYQLLSLTLVLGFYVQRDWELSPRWRTDTLLFENCSERERSLMCISRFVDSGFFEGGCARIWNGLESYSSDYKRRTSYSKEYVSDVPFYHTFCASTAGDSVESFKNSVAGLMSVYNGNPVVSMGMIIGYYKRGFKQEAAQAANEYLLNINSYPSLSMTLLSLYAGALEGICDQLPIESCTIKRDQILRAISKNQYSANAYAFGRGLFLK